MDTLGEFLKGHREKRTITLEEVAKVTRISKTILDAIENGRHELLPPAVFTRGFLKTYASYLELDEGEVLARYQKELEGQEETVDEGEPKNSESLNRVLFSFLLFVLITVFVLGIAFWLFLSPQKEEKTPALNDISQTTSVEPVAPRPVVEPELGKERGEEKVLAVKKEPAITEESEDRDDISEGQEVVTEKMVLKVIAAEGTWIRFQLDREEPFEILLKSGESFIVRADEKFNLKIGNAGGVELFLDEKPLGKPGKKEEVVDLTLPE